MKHVAFLGSRDAAGKNQVADFLQYSSLTGDKDVAYQVVYWEDLLVTIATAQQSIMDTQSGMMLSSFDMVVAFNWYRGGRQALYRDLAYTLALYLQQANVVFWNREMIAQRSTSKVSAMMKLALLKCDIPSTLFSLNGQVLLNAAPLQFPLIVKAAQASRGRDNYRVASIEELNSLLDPDRLNSYLLQEYIPNQEDWRIVCAGGKPVLLIKRQRQDDTTHLNNTSRGGSAEKLDISLLSPGILQACQAICREFGREMAGVDLLIANDGTLRQVFLEVNAIPQLTSGTLVPEKVSALLQAVHETLDEKERIQ